MITVAEYKADGEIIASEEDEYMIDDFPIFLEIRSLLTSWLIS